jgi:hypothetical protein
MCDLSSTILDVEDDLRYSFWTLLAPYDRVVVWAGFMDSSTFYKH